MTRSIRLWVLCAVWLLAAVLCIAAPLRIKAPGNFVPDELLISFKPGTAAAAITKLLTPLKLTVKREITQIHVKVLKVPTGQVDILVKTLSANANVEFAEPNFYASVVFTPNDTSYGNQWGLPKIKANLGWGVTQGSATVKIAILDTGIDQNHPDLASKITANVNYTDSTTVDDNFGHGTHCAGIAAAITNNGTGVAGAGYNCQLMNVKVLGDTGSGYYDWIASGLTYAADNGAKVISMSIGGSGGSSTLENAVNYAWNKGCVIVAAAGNSNSTNASYPGYYTNCICVGATDKNDNRASFSNYGADWVDVAAPGVGIYSTLPNHTNYISTNYLGGTLNYGNLDGTSMATPFVAGYAGLLWASGLTTNTAVRSKIENNCDTIAGGWVAKGRVNVAKGFGITPPQCGLQVLNNGQTVTFPMAFPSTPIVLLSSQNVSCCASNITRTGFKVNLTTDAGGTASNVWVQWVAIKPSIAMDVIGGCQTVSDGGNVTFPAALSASPVIVTNGFKNGKALITNAMNNAATGFTARIKNDTGGAMSSATLNWMAVVPKATNDFKGEVKTYASGANVSFTPAFANGPAYVTSASDAIAGVLNNRSDGFTLRLTRDTGAILTDATWVQWIGWAQP